MRKKITTILALAVIVIIALFALGISAGEKKEVAVNDANNRQVAAQERKMEFSIAEHDHSGEKGAAIFTDIGNGQTKVELDMTGGPKNTDQPAHIHSGSCDSLGGIVYTLNYVRNGYSETILDISLDQLLDEPLAINIHKSSKDLQNYLSCGDIKNK